MPMVTNIVKRVSRNADNCAGFDWKGRRYTGAVSRLGAVWPLLFPLISRYRLAVIGLLTLTLVAANADGQRCLGNSEVGCTRSGAVCKPVTSGGGTSGHCETPTGFPKGEKSCECVGTAVAPPPLLDPRCSNRSATGTFTCTINEPNVTEPETLYPAILFAPGDMVEVNANGCVQTGGSGLTWKRYVNPDSNELYHGLIRVPSGTPGPGLVRIQSVVSNPFLVTGAGVPEAQLFLHLGYEDDNYGDNGYTAHDNGTNDQCLTDPNVSFDGDPAHITITISRGVPAPQPTSTFPFDVLWTQLDTNGLPYNPQWSWQVDPRNGGITPHVPSTSICHNFSVRPTFIGIPDGVLQPSFQDCTDQADQSTVDRPQGSNSDLCNGAGIFESDSFSGHVNWFPVTMEGVATGAPSYSGGPYPLGDDDYTFEFVANATTAPLSVNGEDGLHVEFDSEETINNFTSPEWSELHQDVQNGSAGATQLFSSDTPIAGGDNLNVTIVTGMFGLDGEHSLKSELHPLYALATRRSNYENDPSDDGWLMFVRNQGDEGYCSSRIWYSGFDDYTFHLPWREGMASVSVDWAKTDAAFQLTAGATGPSVAAYPPSAATAEHPAGVYVSFHLGPPVPRTTNLIGAPNATLPFVDGVLHLVWTASPSGYRPPPVLSGGAGKGGTGVSDHPPGKGSEEDGDEIESRLATAIGKLSPELQTQIKNARSTPAGRHVISHKGQGQGPIKALTHPPPTPARAFHAINGGPATRKAMRDAATLAALCKASKNTNAGPTPNVCIGVPVKAPVETRGGK
jgi:hypothetical protein